MSQQHRSADDAVSGQVLDPESATLGSMPEITLRPIPEHLDPHGKKLLEAQQQTCAAARTVSVNDRVQGNAAPVEDVAQTVRRLGLPK